VKKRTLHNQGQVSFSSGTLFSKVSTAASGTSTDPPGNEDDDTWPNKDGGINCRTGGNSNENPLAQQDQSHKEEEAAMHNIILHSFKDDRPFIKMCIDLNLGENMAKVSNQINKKFMEDEDMSCHEWIESFGNQPAPFPFLAINSADNTAVVLHGI